jgi:hypothetical protein
VFRIKEVLKYPCQICMNNIKFYKIYFTIMRREEDMLFPFALFEVRAKGLEPPRIAPPDPKSGAAANYATPAAFIMI